MKNTVINFLEQVKQIRSRRRKAAVILVCLSLIVGGGTAWALHINGESRTGKTYCGYEEHRHSEECIEKTLICGYDTEETAEQETLSVQISEPFFVGHTHTDACYETQTVLTCTETEHTHSAENGCYDEEGNLVCEIPEHIHSEENGCYTTETVLICGLEEGSAEAAEATEAGTEAETEASDGDETTTHVHTDECYEITYICGFDYEHTHTLSCFSNPDADVETAADWEKTVSNVDLTGDFAADLVAIAKTQLGYAESTDNYQVVLDDEGNETTETKGYTRYGAWYGQPYKDWDAMFVSFCLNYAEVPTAAFPRDASCPNWTLTLSDPEKGYELYRDAADYSPYPGDLVFFDTDDDGEADHVGIVSELTPEYTGSEEYYEDDTDYTLTGFKAIEGNSENKVKENEYELTDKTILGYGALSTVVNDGTLAAYTEGDTAKTCTISNLTHNYTDVDGVSQSWTGSITFTVTPPENSTTNYSGYTLCAEEYSNGSAYASAIETYVGVTNDIQYYDIYWKNGDTRVDLETGTTVKIKWDSNSCLYGTTQVGRIARVLPLNESTETGFTKDNEQTLVGLTKDDTEPTGFESITFTANIGSPYAIVSDRVSTGYIDALTVTVESDGTASFTTETDAVNLDDDDNGMESNGCDTSAKNGVVRSFDSIAYKLNVTLASRSDESYSAETAKIYVEMSMDMGLTEAEFDLSQLKWAETEGASWLIEYLNDSGEVVAVRDKDCGDGYVKLVTNGVTATATTSINAITYGSDQGENSYKDTLSIKTQRLTGTYIKTGTGTNTAVPGTQDFSAGIKVLNAANGTVVEPTFRVWLDGNEENYGYADGTTDKFNTPATPQNKSVELKNLYDADDNNSAYAVKVSAGAFYNVEIKSNDYLMYASWFDFAENNEVSANTYTVNGQEVSGESVVKLLEALANLHQNWGKSNPADFTDDSDKYSTDTPADVLPEYPSGTALENYTGENGIFSNIRYGRMFSYGVALQMANLQKNGDYGMKGFSLPVGTISLDLNLTTSATGDDVKSGKVDGTQFYSILWDSSENDAKNSGKQGRNFYWQSSNNSKFARAAVPYNHTFSNGVLVASSCYDGGIWTLSGINGDTSSTTTNESTKDKTYTFQISGYDIDLSSYTFPTNRAMSSGVLAQYASYEYNFSAGQVQVLSVFPRVNSGTVQDNMKITVGNLNVTDLSGHTLSSTTAGTKTIDYSYETNTYGQDNYINKSVTFYEPGSIQKRNSFIRRNGYDLSSQFLGQTGSSDTFWVTSWDATAFIGENIAIIGTGEISEKSDANIEALNLLQLFDSSAFVLADGTEHINESGSLNSTNGSYYVSTKDTNKNTVILLENGEKTTKWTSATILYAADPDYPEGYNTNGYTKSDGTEVTSSEMQEYMNGVREEDLVYYKTLSELESAGYTCVGVLAEVRGCEDILKGYDNGRIALRIPVTLKDDPALVGKTVSTINSLRVWTTEGAMMKNGASISWVDGIWNTSTGINELADYQTIITLTSNHLSGENGIAQENSGNRYTKVEYQDGQKQSGDTGGYYCGNTLLILSYKAGIKIDSEKADANKTYDLSKESNVTYTLSSINTSLTTATATSSSTTTDLTINVTLSGADSGGAALTGKSLDVLLLGEFQMEVPKYEKNEDGTYKTDGNGTYYPVYETDEDGNQVQATETVTFSKDDSVTVIVEYNGTCYPVTFSVSVGEGNQSATINVADAPVGATLPNIILPASLGNGLPNGSSVTATATISGSGDQRAYEEVNGNLSTDTVSIVRLGGSSLSKTVDTTLMELDGIVEYTITYTNDGETTLDTAYFYDILPYNGDIRDTHYTTEDTGEEHNGTFLYNIDANSTKVGSDEDTGDFNGTLTFYYSTYGYDANGVNTDELKALREMLEGFSNQDETAVNDMLKDSAYFTVLGTLKADPDKSDGSTKFTLTEDILKKYDKNEDGDVTEADGEGLTGFRTDILTKITCVYAKVVDMGPRRSLNLKLSMRTQDNAGADVYGNVAWGWAPNMGGTLRSEIVRTYVVSRSISGVVWYDANLDGVKDDGEKTLDGEPFPKKWTGNAEKKRNDSVPNRQPIQAAEAHSLASKRAGEIHPRAE